MPIKDHALNPGDLVKLNPVLSKVHLNGDFIMGSIGVIIDKAFLDSRGNELYQVFHEGQTKLLYREWLIKVEPSASEV